MVLSICGSSNFGLNKTAKMWSSLFKNLITLPVEIPAWGPGTSVMTTVPPAKAWAELPAATMA
jgi:hypothetical protein